MNAASSRPCFVPEGLVPDPRTTTTHRTTAGGIRHRDRNQQGGKVMTVWTRDELSRIGTEPELQIASPRGDGTLHKPVTIWVVPHGDDLYIRSYKGRDGKWF